VRGESAPSPSSRTVRTRVQRARARGSAIDADCSFVRPPARSRFCFGSDAALGEVAEEVGVGAGDGVGGVGGGGGAGSGLGGGGGGGSDGAVDVVGAGSVVAVWRTPMLLPLAAPAAIAPPTASMTRTRPNAARTRQPVRPSRRSEHLKPSPRNVSDPLELLSGRPERTRAYVQAGPGANRAVDGLGPTACQECLPGGSWGEGSNEVFDCG
jgi:hypothetical protein